MPTSAATATYALAYSPCPNDTYIFAALTNGLLENAPHVRVHLADIEELNTAALRAEYALTKVSYGAIPYLMRDYRILRAGGALGRGCGPLVVTRPGAFASLSDLADARIAIPGERTTAFMLLQLALGKRPRAAQMRFDAIIPAVAAGEFDAGLIIHESRFTYAQSGLVSIADLGDWWESQSGMPIPLGAILVRNDVGDEQARHIDDAIRASLSYAREHETAIMPYVRDHAFEMSDDVMRKHVDLYVNEFSDDVGSIGIAAVEELFRRARVAGILEADATPRFSR
ncbi:MAG TPA: 1,4-dihydroxy-6-naphthoate synthase [Candidatus Baltobacteraceae bacterium]|nr:1,4-dihydroxy-6-naphthoate synthase [Candidatus Baltobacteraceae bacterium]